MDGEGPQEDGELQVPPLYCKQYQEEFSMPIDSYCLFLIPYRILYRYLQYKLFDCRFAVTAWN